MLLILVVLLAVTATVRTYVLLLGRRAVRGVECSGEDAHPFYIYLGPGSRRLAATPVGCRNCGSMLWLLCFLTEEGAFRVMVDVRRQEPLAVRRLARRLFNPAAKTAEAVRAARRPQADTIPPKV